MKYLILGAGYYGCYLGLIFKILGIDFLILEKNSDIFTGSSSKNQNRLHEGFHYPRSKETRNECKKGWDIFNRLFNFMTIGVNNNYYLIDSTSKVSYNDYVNIYRKEGYKFTEIHDLYNIDMNMNNISGIIRCNEKIIKHKKAYEFFKRFLSDKIIFNYDVKRLSHKPKIIYNSQEYDYLINCTYGQALRDTFNNVNMEYELCLTLVYSSTRNGMIDHSITVMDGKYFSIYPYDSIEKNKFTLTDVEHTPLFCSTELTKVQEFERKLTQAHINIIKRKIEDKVLKYIPKFHEIYKYDSHYVSYKCKIKNDTADRSLKVFQSDKIINFMGGKITGMFSMPEILFQKISELGLLNTQYLQKNKDVISRILRIFNRTVNQSELDYHSNNASTHKHLLNFIYEIIECDEFKQKYVLPIMKIAVCFFGYTRDLERNIKTHANLFRLNPDIFIHTFTSSGKKSTARYRGGEWIKENELNNQINVTLINNTYKPKKIVIEKNDLQKFSINDGRIIPLLIYQAHDDATRYINSQLYTKHCVCELMRQYEAANKISYDIVILTRFDFGYELLELRELLGLDMSNIYFPGFNSGHGHPGKGGGCLNCDAGKYHFGCTHSNDMCDVWAISCSSNIVLLGKLFLDGKQILKNSRYISNDYIIKNNIKHRRDKNFVYVYERFEEEKLVCYYPERLMREYLKDSICLTYNKIKGRLNVSIN